jgi:toxin-antitoxin system PIN domain toxin
VVTLLDVNVLVALFDPLHVHHELAHSWFAGARAAGWASCPITENGLVRVVANPAYPGRRTTVGDAVARLTLFRASGGHAFWPDDVSLCDGALRVERLAGHRQITDGYLLALAVRRGGRLATLDRGLTPRAVPEARAESLVHLGVES